MNIMEDDELRAEDIMEVNELTLQENWLQELLYDYSAEIGGHYNRQNDKRVLELVNMVLRCGTLNEGLTRIILQ